MSSTKEQSSSSRIDELTLPANLLPEGAPGAMVKAPTTWAEGVGGAAMPASSRSRRSSQTGTTSSRHHTNSATAATSRKRPTSTTYADTTSSSSSGDANPLTLSGSAIGVDLSRGVSREEILRRRNKLAALNESMSSDRALVPPRASSPPPLPGRRSDEAGRNMKRNLGHHELLQDSSSGGGHSGMGKMKRVGSEDALGASVDSNSAGSLPLAMRELSIEIGVGPTSSPQEEADTSSSQKYVEYEGKLNDEDESGRDRREGMKKGSSREASSRTVSSRTVHSKSTAHTRSTTGSITTAAMNNLERGGVKNKRSPRRRSSQARNEELLKDLEHMVTAKDFDKAVADKNSDEMEGWMMTAAYATATARAADEDNELDEEYRAVFADAQQRRLEEVQRHRRGSGDRDRDNEGRDRDRHGRAEPRRGLGDRDGHRDRTEWEHQHQHQQRRSSSDHHRPSRRSSVDHIDADAKSRRMKELEMQLQAMEEEKLRLEQEQLAERMREIDREKRRLEKEEAMKQQRREMEAAGGMRKPVRRRKSGSAIEAGSRLLEELNGLDLAPEATMHNSAPDLEVERDSLREAAQRSKQRRRSSMVSTSRRGSGDERVRKISDLDITGAMSPSRERERDRSSRRRSSRGYTAQIDAQDLFDGERSSRRSSMKCHSRSRSREHMERMNDDIMKEKRNKRPSESDMPQEMSLSHSELDQELLRGLPGMLKRENSDERNKRKTMKRENSGDRHERRSSNQPGMLKRENSDERNKRKTMKRENSGDRHERRSSNQGKKKERRPSVQFAADEEIIARRRSADDGVSDKPRKAERRGSMQSTGVHSIESKQSQHASLASAVGEAVRTAEWRNTNERERIKAEGGDAQSSNQPKVKVSRRSSVDTSAISNARTAGSKSQSTIARRNSDPSEPKEDFPASRRTSISAVSTPDTHSNISRRGSTSNMLKDSGVMLLSADIDLGDEPKSKLRLKKLAKKLTLKKSGDPERVPSIFDR